MLTTRRWIVPCAALGGFLPFALGACGGGGASSSSGHPSSPVVFAVTTSLTGQYADSGIPILEGAKAAALEINDAGGILGQKLQLDTVDTLADPGDAVPAVNKELAVGHPVALVGMKTGEIHAVEPIFDRAHIPDAWMGGDTAFTKNTDPWMWDCVALDSQLGLAMALEARDKGYATAATIISYGADTQSLQDSVTQPFTALGGKIVDSEQITSNQTSYLSEVQKIINAHPAVIFAQLTPSDAGVVFGNFKELDNLGIPFIGTDQMGSPPVIQAIGPSVAKAHVISLQGSTALSGSGQEFAMYYQEANGHAPLNNSAQSYDCTIAFALAITKAGTTDPNVWTKDMTAVTNPPGTQVSDYKTAVADIKAGMKINYEGVSGPLDFNQYHNVAGPWDVVQASGSGTNVTTLTTITADQIQTAAKQIGS